MRKETVSVLLLSLGLALVVQAAAQDSAPPRRMSAARAVTAPVVDGALDDPLWSGANWQGGFTQLKPELGAPARAETRVSVAYDERWIYVAFRCLNPAGPATRSKQTRRDSDMDQDNAVTLYLDTFHTRRDCYFFSTNSLGIRVDGRIAEDGSRNDKSWDCAWQVAAREDSAGWCAEMAIPVRELRIPSGDPAAWGINFRRNYPEYFETSFWQERDTAWRISQSGVLDSLPRFRKGFSATLYPYLVGLDSNSPASGRRAIVSSGGSELVGGADLLLGLGASANASLSWNPDFATVEADEDVINLTRYETFYPEKRLYFLEGAELLNNSSVFYSRRIGDMDWGVKTNGRTGAFNYALLSARERSSGGDPSAQTSVFRLQRDILGRSNAGLMAVERSADGVHTRVLNTDLNLQLPADFLVQAGFTGSFPSDGDFNKSYFIEVYRGKESYNCQMTYQSIDPGFREAVSPVGFVQDDNRRSVDAQVAGVKWIRRGWLEKVQGHSMNTVFWGYDRSLRDVSLNQWGAVTFLGKWLVGAGNNYHTELFEKRFHNHNWFLEGGYNQQSWNNTSWIFTSGRNFDRDFRRYVFRQKVKPIPELSLSYSFNRVNFMNDPDNASTSIHVLTGDWNFTPDLWLRLFTQYNSRNDRIYVYGLFGWRFAPPFGALYVAYTADRFDDLENSAGLADPLRRRQRAFFAKLTLPVALLE